MPILEQWENEHPLADREQAANMESTLDARIRRVRATIPRYSGRDDQLLEHHLNRLWLAHHEAGKLAEALVEAERQAKDREQRLRRRYGGDESTIAAAAAHLGKTRALAEKLRGPIRQGTNDAQGCPYCEGPLGTNTHVDHIVPVCRGGLSTPDNLVVVCAACNRAKAGQTLREFTKARGLDRESVESRLEALGKRV